MESNNLPKEGLLRLSAIIGNPPGTGPIPVSRAAWYRWMKQGLAPKPIKLGPRIVVWRAEDIRSFMDSLPRS